MHQLSHNFFPQKSVLQEIKIFNRSRPVQVKMQMRDREQYVVMQSSVISHFQEVLSYCVTNTFQRVKYFRFFHHLTSSLGWISIWRNPDQMIAALLRAMKRTLWKKLKKIFNVPCVIYR